MFGWRSEKPPKRDFRIEELTDEIETMKRQVRSLQLEWESTYNKIRAILARFNKRDEREEEVAAITSQRGAVPRAVNGGDPRVPLPRLPGPTERNY